MRPARRKSWSSCSFPERSLPDQATVDDVALLGEVAGQIVGKCLCPLGEFSTSSPIAGLRLFEDDFRAHVADKKKKAAPRKPAAKAPAAAPVG